LKEIHKLNPTTVTDGETWDVPDMESSYSIYAMV
jgi:hypothetical protein